MSSLPVDSQQWLNLMSCGAVVQDSNGRTMHFNAAALELLELTESELRGQTRVDPQWTLVRGDHSPFPDDELPAAQCRVTGKPVVRVLVGVYRAAAGAYRWLQVSSQPLGGAGVSGTYATITTFDEVTHWKSFQDEVQREQHLFSQGPVALVETLLPLGQVRFMSRSFESLFGLNSKEFLSGSRRLSERIDPEDRPAFERQVTQALKDPSLAESQGRFRFLDGLGRWREVSHRTVYDRSQPKQPLSSLSYWLDRTEEAQSMRRLAMTLEVTGTGTWDWSPINSRVLVDDQWCNLVGAPRATTANLTFSTWAELLHPEERAGWLALEQQLLNGDRLWFDVEVRQDQRGKWAWFRIRGRVSEFNELGFPLHVLGTQEDVSDLFAAKAERKDLAQVVEQGPSAVLMTTVGGEIEYVNRQFTLQSGYSLHEVKGKNSRLLKTESTSPEVFTQLWAKLLSGEAWVGELQNRRKDGSHYWVEAIISPLVDPTGRTVRYAGQQIDITERKQAEDEARSAQRKADAANRAKSDFLAHISHEIRTPMNGILGLAELSLTHDLHPEVRHQLEGIRTSGTTLLELVNDLLDLAKIEAGKMELERTAFSLMTAVDQALAPLAVLAEQKKLSFRVVWGLDGERPRWGDPRRLRQLLTNLVGNALKYTDEGGIEIAIGGAEVVEFSVRDTGPGIEPENRPLLFQRFTQFTSNSRRGTSGTGLGLAICQELVTALGGKVGHRNPEPGPGSIFWFELPLPRASEQMSTENEPNDTPLPTDASDLRVLVVDDNPVNQIVAKGLLMRFGIQPNVASNGLEALDLLIHRTFDLVFMDVQMPGLDGYAATRAIRAGHGGEHHRGVTIVAMTAHAMRSDQEACLAAGMDDYLAKPVSLKQLSQVLKRWRSIPIVEGSNVKPSLATERVFDEKEMRERLQLADDLLKQIIELFLHELPERRQSLKQALENRDFALLKKLAHTLKGTASNLVARGVVDAALELELAAQEDRFEQAPLRVDSLLNEIDALATVLTKYVAEH